MYGDIKCDIVITSVWVRETIESSINWNNAVNVFSEYDMYFFYCTSRNRNEKNQSSRKTYLQKKNKINIYTSFNYNVNINIR